MVLLLEESTPGLDDDTLIATGDVANAEQDPEVTTAL